MRVDNGVLLDVTDADLNEDGSFSFPEGVTSIGDLAFRACSSLNKISIPAGVTSIGHLAFSHCSSLRKITIPAGVTSIGDQAFGCCDNLETVLIEASSELEFERIKNMLPKNLQKKAVLAPAREVKNMIYHNNPNYFKWIFGPANWVKAESDFLLPKLSEKTKDLYEEAKTPETLLDWLQVDDEQTLSNNLTNMKMGK